MGENKEDFAVGGIESFGIIEIATEPRTFPDAGLVFAAGGGPGGLERGGRRSSGSSFSGTTGEVVASMILFCGCD